MKRKLIAAAFAIAVVAPAHAQAPSGNVTLYGRVNVDLEVVSGQQADGSNPNVYRLSSNSSRVGVRGTEPLASGLDAIFQIESSVNADSGGGTLAGRETYVGLQGTWGTLKMGYFLNPYDDFHGVFGNTPTLLTGILATGALWANGISTDAAPTAFDSRLPNSIRYDSPTLRGMTFGVQYGSAEGVPRSNSGALSAGLFYTNGPVQLGTVYDRYSNTRAVGLVDQAWSIGGGYNFGLLRPAVAFERIRYETPSGDLERNFWGGSLIIPAGGGSFYAFVGAAGEGKGSAAAGTRIRGLARGPDTKATQYELTYTYPLSKRTLLYGGFVRVDNACNASYTFSINAYPVGRTSGGCFGSPQGFVLGTVHLF